MLIPYQTVGKEEVTQIVRLHLLLNTIFGPLGFCQGRLVNSRIAHKAIERTILKKLLHILSEFSGRCEGIKVTFHYRYPLRIKSLDLRNGLHFNRIPNSAYDMKLVIFFQQSSCSLFPKARRSACDDAYFFTPELVSRKCSGKTPY